MNVRPGTLAAALCIVVFGFAIGAWLAIRTRGPAGQPQRVTLAAGTVAAPPVHTMAPLPARSAPPAATPTPAAAAVSTLAPSTRTTDVAASSTGRQSWQLVEANVQVGTIRWLGSAEAAGDKTIVFNLRKQSVGGRAAVPCERQTVLHATFSLGVAQQSVPYHEVNCNGVVSTGEVRVRSVVGTSATFSGSFSQSGVDLGTFTASKL